MAREPRGTLLRGRSSPRPCSRGPASGACSCRAMFSRDYPLLMGILLLGSVMVVVFNSWPTWSTACSYLRSAMSEAPAAGAPARTGLALAPAAPARRGVARGRRLVVGRVRRGTPAGRLRVRRPSTSPRSGGRPPGSTGMGTDDLGRDLFAGSSTAGGSPSSSAARRGHRHGLGSLVGRWRSGGPTTACSWPHHGRAYSTPRSRCSFVLASYTQAATTSMALHHSAC